MIDRRQELINEVIKLSEECPSEVCSRSYFRKNSDFTEHAVRKEFGNFTELLRAAGLVDGRLTQSFNNRRAQLDTEVRFNEYVTKHVKPWARSVEAKDKDQITMVIGSDFHGEHVNPFALDVFIDTIERIKPDYVILAGDVANFEAVGRWTKNPNRLHVFQHEVSFITDKILRRVRAAAGPDAIIDFILGNHEMWLQRLLAEHAPGLASLDCLSFGELFKLTELNINLIMGGDMLAPTTRDKRVEAGKAWKIYHDTFVVTHGTATGRNAAATELNRFKVSGCSGHLHTPSTAFSSSLDRPHLEWNILPMMCQESVGEIYLKGLPTTWSAGFAVVDIFPKTKTHFYSPVHIRGGIAVSEGVVYRDERS